MYFIDHPYQSYGNLTIALTNQWVPQLQHDKAFFHIRSAIHELFEGLYLEVYQEHKFSILRPEFTGLKLERTKNLVSLRGAMRRGNLLHLESNS